MDTVNRATAALVPRRILSTLLAGISAGVVPRTGAPYIAIGRGEEIRALSADLSRVAEGSSSMRFLVGRYGSGKSFLIQLMRAHAMDLGFLVADADLSPERRLAGEGGLSTYRELSRNLSLKAAPDGGAWSILLGQWIASLSESVTGETDADYRENFLARVRALLFPLRDEVGGYDYAAVLEAYVRAHLRDDTEAMSAALRWLRGEFRTKTEARAALGMRSLSVIDDANWYLHLRLLARFSRIAGRAGLVVFLDECVNLYKIPNRVSREANYEKILSMYNDTLQGVADGMMLILGGTPRFLEDTRRGLFSYEALKSRLSDARFAEGADTPLKNMMSPVIRLRRLSDNELFALCVRLRALHAQYYGTECAVTDEMIEAFLTEELKRAGADEMITPREIIRDFVSMLDLLYQNPSVSFAELLRRTETTPLVPKAEAAAPAPITIPELTL